MIEARKLLRAVMIASAGLAALVVVGAYAAIGVYTGNAWPWLELVHETGDRSLLATLFYFEHAARELPLDIVLAVAVAGSVRFAVGSRPTTAEQVATSRRRRNRLSAAALAVAMLIVGGTLVQGDTGTLVNNLSQMHTRPGAPLSWGAHWRYHLLSRAILIGLSFGLAGLLVWVARGASGRGDGVGLRATTQALVAFALLSLVFLPDLAPFRDPVFIGHQVREVMTHALVTVPAAFAMCLWLARRDFATAGTGIASIRAAVVCGVLACVLGLYLLFAGITMESASQGQTANVILLIAPHFFEHGFSYVLVALLAGALYETASIRAVRPPKSGSGAK